MTECTRPQGVTQSSDYLTATALFSSSFPFYSFFTRFPFFLSPRESVDTLFLHLFPRNPYSCQMIYFYPPSFSPLAASLSAQVPSLFFTFLNLSLPCHFFRCSHSHTSPFSARACCDRRSVLSAAVFRVSDPLIFHVSPSPTLSFYFLLYN